MTIGLASGFKIYQDQFQSGIVETLTQNGNAFNQASNGAIQLSTASRKGDFSEQAFFKLIANGVSRRDTTSAAAATDLNLTEDEWVSVKLNRKIGPYAQSRDSFRKIQAGNTEQELSFIIGQQVAAGMQLDMLNSALRGVVGALTGQAAVTAAGAGATLATTDLVDGLKLFGDAADRIKVWVMHSEAYYDLVKNQITQNIYGVSNFNVSEGSPVTLNRPVLVTDSPALLSGSGYLTLGLSDAAVLVENSEQEEVIFQDITGLENLGVRMQGEFAYNLGVKGFKWVIASGANPLDAALSTSANWTPTRASQKDFAGVVITSAATT